MKSVAVYCFSLLFTGNFLQGQNSYSKISYICSTNLAKGSVHDGLNTMYFDNAKSLFIHNDFPKEDHYQESGTIIRYVKGDSEGLPVFINLTDKYLYYKSEYAATKNEIFIFKESLPKIDWVISKEERNIDRFHCIKAIGIFGGRTYDVWFTPEIPVGLGPYKLWGLPGMILDAKSRDGRVGYTFHSYESPTNDPVNIAKPTKGREISWEEFRTFVINKLLQAEALSTPGVTITNNDPHEDYEIERSKFTIISEYKSQRTAKRNRQ